MEWRGRTRGTRSLIAAIAVAGILAAPGAAQALDAERAFGPEWRVNTSLAGRQNQPRVAMDPDGGFVVVWRDDLGDSSSFFALALKGQRYGADGAALGGEFRLDGGGSGGSYAIAMDALGRFVVVHYSPVQDFAVFRLFAPDGLPLGDERALNLLPDETLGVGRPAGMAADGNFVVVSNGATDVGTLDIRARLFDARGDLRGSGPFVPVVSGLNAGWQHNAAVGVGPGGEFVVVWNDVTHAGSNGLDTQIYARLFRPDGSSLSPPFLVSTTPDGNVDPQVALDPAGNFVIAWTHAQDHIRARAYDSAGVPRGPDFQVSQGGQAAQPDVAMDGAGASVITWYNVVDNTREDIFVRRYDAAAQPRDPAPVQINVTGNGDGRGVQLYPRISMDPDGDFVVAWEDRAASTGGTDTDIRARRYALPAGADDKVDAAVPPAAAAGGAWSARALLSLLLLVAVRRRR
jgi:hypothetical protein